MENLITYNSTASGAVIFDFDNRQVRFQRNNAAETLKEKFHFEDIDIAFDDITEIEFSDSFLTGGCFNLVVNGYHLVSDVDGFQTYFAFNTADRSSYKKTMNRLAEDCGIVGFKSPIRNSVPKKRYGNTKEYRMKCNACGKVYCYSDADLHRNRVNQEAASTHGKLSVLNAVAGTQYDMYEQSKQRDRALAQIVDYSKCPYCNSISITELTEQEFQAANAQTSTAVSSADEIMKFKELLDKGIITQEEFDQKKKQLLGL